MQNNPVPCPFCSSEPIVIQRGARFNASCTCDGKRLVQTYGKSRMEAVESWNERANTEAAEWRKRALWAEGLRPLTRQFMSALQDIAIAENVDIATDIACRALSGAVPPDLNSIPSEPAATIYAEICRLHEEHKHFVFAGQILSDLKAFILLRSLEAPAKGSVE